MSQISRFLKRNREMFVQPPYCVLPDYTVPYTDPTSDQWEWPRWVTTPYLYGVYIQQLHLCRKMPMRYPTPVFQRFASQHADLGYERLTRAAAFAASVCKHPFSPKFIKKFLDKVPSKEIIQQRVF